MSVCLLALACLLAAPPYQDPAGLFSLGPVPAGWQVEVSDGDGGLRMTILADGLGPAVAVITLPLQQEVPANQSEAEATGMIESILQIATSRVLNKQFATEALAGRQVVRCDYVAEVEGQGVRQGTAVAFFNGRTAYLGIAGGPRDDAAAQQAAARYLATLRLPGEAAAPAPGGGLFDAATLRGVAGGVEGRDDPNRVLAEGEPPLTVASVRNFCDYVGALFSLKFTAAEFELTKARFIEYYGKADAEGRQIIALGGAALLEQLPRASEQEIAETRQQMAAQFAAGAEMGIEWAAAMHEAITRRQTSVARTTAKPPAEAMQSSQQQQVDQDFSQADLTAAVELIYFMWVATGHDPNAATPEVVAQLQNALVQNFGRFDAEFQAVLCNAERVYAAVRAAWDQADQGTRAQLVQEFGQALVGLGLVEGGGGAGGGGDAWSDVNPDEVRSGLVMNTCWNLAQRSTGGW